VADRELACIYFDAERGCGLKVVEGIPTAADCSNCSKYDGPARGLGDHVHTVAKTLGIDRVVKKVTRGKCGCEERRNRMNRQYPSKD